MAWYEIKSKSEKAEIWIYDFIGEDYWSGSGVSAKNFQKDLSALKAGGIDLHINSPGGDVFDGIAIYNMLKQHPARVTTYIDGLAASIASLIALSGDEVYMAENALFMIHKPWSATVGNAHEHEKTIFLLNKVEEAIIKPYLEKTGKAEEDIKNMMGEETWMDSKEALEMGFIDGIQGRIDLAACSRFIPAMSKAGFKKIPDEIKISDRTPTAKDADKALRSAGFSRKQTKTILAKGISEYLRNVDTEDAEVSLRNVEGTEPDVITPEVHVDSVSALLIQAEIIAPKQSIKKE